MFKLFTRTIEDFTCEHCGCEVRGNGYTNHCTQCLWSKHVDINPGDRLESCGGLMEPVSTERKGKGYSIAQKCLQCGFVRNDHLRDEDSFEPFLELSKKAALKMSQGE